MRHLVQFSTGAGSAEVCYRVVAAHGADSTTFITADTLIEDEDNWRFAGAVVRSLGITDWVVLQDGRTPMQVGRDERCVPNDRMAVCSKILKRELMRRFMDEHFDPADSLVYLGFDWMEERRMRASLPHWTPWRVEAPLMNPPYLTKYHILDAMRSRGIEPPRLYAMGFAHANCGGGCVRSGQAQWRLLLNTMPERYAEWELEEEASRSLLGKDVTILKDRRGGTTKPLSLRAFRLREEFDPDDWGACGCTDELVSA